MESRVPLHEEKEFLDALRSAGLNEALSQKVIYSKGNKVAREMVEAINKKEEKVTNPFLAREIMGKNMFGVEEAIRYFGVHPSSSEMYNFSEVPFSKEFLQKASNSYVLVALFPISILEMRARVGKAYFSDCSCKGSFIEKYGVPGWLLFPKIGPLTRITIDGQELPTAREIVYLIIGHFLASGEWLFEDLRIKSSSKGDSGSTVYVGNCHQSIFYFEGLKF